MKRPKDRLHRVVIIGANPAGVAAANKLGELGIPVTLIDSEPDLDQKLSREEWRLPSGLSLNFAHRSGLVRIMRNPLIRCIMPAEILSMRHSPQGFRAHVKCLPTFVDPDLCTLCGRCAEVCPVVTPEKRSPISLNGRRTLPGRPVIEKRQTPLCQTGCPLGVNVQGYVALTGAGRFREALDLVRKDNILPGICGRICTHPCENDCRRGELDEPIAVRDIKRFLADYELSHPQEAQIPETQERDERIAIIGSGPAGLAAAADLARLGYRATVFEKEAEAGGLLRYGIGAHRLPRDILDRELDYIQRLGVEFITSHPMPIPEIIEKLKVDFDAVILTTGTWEDRMLGVPGEDLEGVEGCLSFLSRLYRGEVNRIDEEVAVIGDGNAAFDLARTLRRLGASVTVLSWFPADLIPADEEEIRGAREEGITVTDCSQVIAFKGRGGRLDRLQCRPTRPGKPDAEGVPWPVIIPGSQSFDLKFDRAFLAIGQQGPFKDLTPPSKLTVKKDGFIETDESSKTNVPAVYSAGDTVTGPSSVVEAMSAGRDVARTVHRDLSGDSSSGAGHSRSAEKEFLGIPPDIPSLARPTMPERQPAARADHFSEVSLGLNKAQVLYETERCLQCGICSECLLCEEACKSIGAIHHHDQSEEQTVHAGVVIIADPEAAPNVRGEDVIRAYGPKAAKSDVYAMISRGFAAAAKAMILLKGNSQGQKGRGFSFASADPELSPEIRVGVFACRCNDAYGWNADMTEYVERLRDQEDIVHAEVMPSACIPEGISHIIRVIRDKGITRVALASCVCCPLDFVCSACTDQRSRLKDTLFKGTGVSRSMVETCNMRGEALLFLRHDENLALERFTGLMERSIQRAKKLKPLPTPPRAYNFTTAVIGQSEAAFSSARTLAEAGLDVFMFGTTDRPLSKKPPHSSIHPFEQSRVKGLSGTLGDFQVFVETDSFAQVVQVGAVILGERARRQVPYIHQESLPGGFVTSTMQKRGIRGIPYCLPGATPVSGLFLASPKDLQISEKIKGAAAAVLTAAIMPRGPRKNKGFTVVVDENRCRGCGRCIKVCSYHAVTFHRNPSGVWGAVVDEALCKGCGNCISVCPSNAADSPYRDHAYLEQMIEEVLVQ